MRTSWNGRSSAWVAMAMLALTLAGCASSGVGSGTDDDPNLIGSWELAEVQDMNALDAIRRLRPGWLRVRANQPRMAAGPDEPPPPALAAAGFGSPYPTVHVDGVPLQDYSELETLRTSDIQEIRFLNGVNASTRFGTGYTNGAILVTIKR